MVRDLCPALHIHPRDHHVLVVGGAGQYGLDLSLVTFVVTLGRR
jgi:quercetin dioxygenase-like cupin family protein